MVCNGKLLRLWFIFLLIGVGWSLPTSCIGQASPLRHYTVEDGLLSSAVDKVLQDSRGFMWFATDVGVSRFDGSSFKHYTEKDGLTGSDVFFLQEDSMGKLWMLPFKREPCYLWQDSIYAIGDPNLFNGKFMYRMVIDHHGSQWFMGSHDLFEVTSTGIIKDWHSILWDEIKTSIIGKGFTLRDMLLRKDGRIVVASSFGIHTISAGQSTYVQYPIQGRVRESRMFENSRGDLIISYLEILPDQNTYSHFALFHNGQYQSILRKADAAMQGLPDPFKNNGTIWMMEDHLGVMWVATFNGLHRYTFDDQYHLVNYEHWLLGQTITQVFEDRELNIWVTTTENGVYLFSKNSRFVYNYNAENGLSANQVNLLCARDNELYLGYTSGEIDKILNWDMTQVMQRFQNGSNCIQFLTFDRHSNLWYQARNEAVKVMLPSGTHHTLGFGAVHELFVDEQDQFYLGSSIGYMVMDYAQIDRMINSGFIVVDSLLNPNKRTTQRTHCIEPDFQGQSWFGTDQGLFSNVGDQLTDHTKEYKQFDNVIRDLDQFQLGGKAYLVVVTFGSGIGLYDGQNYYPIDVTQGLSSNVCTHADIDKDNDIWVATNKGLNRVHFNGSPEDFKLVNYNKQDGFGSEEINDFHIEGAMIYVATMNGLSVFNKDSLSLNQNPPLVYIEEVRVNEVPYKLVPNIEFAYDKRNLEFRFVGLDYASVGKVTYQYKLNGVEDQWISTPQPSVRFAQLPSGQYTFQVRAIDSQSLVSPKPATFQFSIQQPYWRAWWFWFAIVVLLITIIWIAIWLRYRSFKQTALIQNRLLESEQKALRAQMNPHFVFNTLNSIQHLISENDNVNANIYLSKFAGMIRKILYNSKQSHITLDDEISFLELYLELESLRFSNRFEYEIIRSPELESGSLLIPAMVVQPFVENALRHGLLYKEGNGKLTVTFKEEGEALFCSIEDNGIGRKRSQELKAQRTVKHQSMGMSITTERLEVLSKQENQQLHIYIDDLYNEQGEATGTRVRLEFPLIFKSHRSIS